MSEKPCFIYVIATVFNGEAVAPVKIGISATPLNRLRELQTGSAHRLMIAHMLRMPSREIASLCERSLHDLYAPESMSGEWFNICPDFALGGLICEAFHQFGGAATLGVTAPKARWRS